MLQRAALTQAARFLGLSLLSLLTNTLPGPSASEVTTLWRYANLFIIIIIFYTPGSIDPGVKNYKLKANITGGYSPGLRQRNKRSP